MLDRNQCMSAAGPMHAFQYAPRSPRSILACLGDAFRVILNSQGEGSPAQRQARLEPLQEDHYIPTRGTAAAVCTHLHCTPGGARGL